MSLPNSNTNEPSSQHRPGFNDANYGQLDDGGAGQSKPSLFSSWMPALIVLTLVFGLVSFVGIKSEVAKWYIAAANNALRDGDIEEYENSLDAAIRWDSKIHNYPPYLTLQLEKLMIDGSPDDVERFLSSIPEEIDTQAVSNSLAQSSVRKGQFKIAFAVITYFEQVSKKPLGPDTLNEHAYLRALRGQELNIALDQINEAIAEGVPTLGSFSNLEMSQEAAYRDTRAWVLYRLERYQDALDEINASISLIEKVHAEIGLELEPVDEPPETKISPSIDKSSTEYLTARHIELQEYLNQLFNGTAPFSKRQTFQLGVLRYHRMKILESIGDEKQSETDRKWLNQNNLTEPVVLH